MVPGALAEASVEVVPRALAVAALKVVPRAFLRRHLADFNKNIFKIKFKLMRSE
jgi:flagellar biosynthesis protein FliQ